MEILWKLTDTEKNVLLPLAVQLLKDKTNKNIFTNAEIVRALQPFSEEKIHDSRIRAIVFNIRQQELVPLLIANHEGYYRGTNIQEIKRWIERHKSKITAMQSTLGSIENQFKQQMDNLMNDDNELNGQLSIFDNID